MKLIGTLPKDTANGLDVRLSRMVNNPEETHLAVLRLRTASITEKVGTGERESALKILGIEAVLEEDSEIGADLMRRAFQARTGTIQLDLDGEDEDTLVRRWRKRPVTIEAAQWGGTVETATAIIDWILEGEGTARFHDCIGSEECEGPHGPFRYCGADPSCSWEDAEPYLSIDTLEGTMQALAGDWIIRGVQGEHYPCKPDIFEQTYTPDRLPAGMVYGELVDLTAPEGETAPEHVAAHDMVLDILASDNTFNDEPTVPLELPTADAVAGKVMDALIAAGWRPTITAPVLLEQSCACGTTWAASEVLPCPECGAKPEPTADDGNA